MITSTTSVPEVDNGWDIDDDERLRREHPAFVINRNARATEIPPIYYSGVDLSNVVSSETFTVPDNYLHLEPGDIPSATYFNGTLHADHIETTGLTYNSITFDMGSIPWKATLMVSLKFLFAPILIVLSKLFKAKI